MRFTEAGIARFVCETVEEVQEMSGEDSTTVSGATCPIYDLVGFESLRGVEATAYIEIKLGITIEAKEGTANLFVCEEREKALTVAEAVSRIVSIMN